MSRIVSVAVPVPALDVLTYRWPEDAPAPVVGARADVPLGPRRLTGIVVATGVTPDPAMKLRDVLAVRDDAAFVPPALVTLATWVADYYVAGPGDVLTSALPPRVLTGDATTFKRRRGLGAERGQTCDAAGAAMAPANPRAGAAPPRSAPA